MSRISSMSPQLMPLSARVSSQMFLVVRRRCSVAWTNESRVMVYLPVQSWYSMMNWGAGAGGELPLDPFRCGHHDALALKVLAGVDAELVHESVAGDVHDSLVPVLASQEVVPFARDDVGLPVLERDDVDIERSSAEVVDHQSLLLGVVVSVV